MIPKVIFKFDKEKDLYNIWETCNKGKAYGYDFSKKISNEVLNMCKGKKFSKSKEKLTEMLYKYHKNILIKDIKKAFNISWKNIEKEYFERLEKITKRKINFKKVNAYLTFAPRCPYDYNKEHLTFYVKVFESILSAMSTAGHELMHIHLHNTDWWKKVEKEIGYNKTHDLKEALTVLLNLKFIDLWIVKDNGYPNHIKLREFISKEWEKEKDFDKLTDNCIKWIKKNGLK